MPVFFKYLVTYKGRNFITDEELCYKKFNKAKNEFEISKLTSEAVVVKDLNEDIKRVYCLDGSLDMRYKENRQLVPQDFDFREAKIKLEILKY